jgi:hypothetical protein
MTLREKFSWVLLFKKKYLAVEGETNAINLDIFNLVEHASSHYVKMHLDNIKAGYKDLLTSQGLLLHPHPFPTHLLHP